MTWAESIAKLLRGHRFRFGSEKDLQDGIARVLFNAMITHRREVRLTDRDVIDFVVGDTLGLEVKVDGSAQQIARQLMRYAKNERLTALLLVTRRYDHGRSFPETIAGKPLTVVTLEASSL